MSVITLSTQDNAKPLDQLKSGFKQMINWNKCQLKRSLEKQNPYLDYLVDPNFQGVNTPFVLSFEDNAVKNGHRKYFLLTVEIKDYNIIGKKLF